MVYLNVVLYVYYMHQTKVGTNVSLAAKIILADYNMSKLKYPRGNVLIVLVSQHSILVTTALAILSRKGKIDLFVVSIASFVNRLEIEP